MEKLNSTKLPVTTQPLLGKNQEILFSSEEGKNIRLSLRPQKSLVGMKSMRPRVIIPSTVTDKK
jgi:hypothetical protein